MTDKSSQLEHLHELHLNAEKIASLKAEEFQKIPAWDIQALLLNVVKHAEQLEKEKEALKKSHLELEEFQQQCLDLYNFAPVGYFNLDEKGVITNVNITASDMLNFPKDELLNSDFISLIHPEQKEAFSSYLKRISESGVRLSTELKILRSEGTSFYAQLQTIALKDKGVYTYRVSVADISDRKQAENNLKENEEKYRMLFESMEEGYAFCEMIYDQSGNPVDFRYLAVNPAFAKLTGLPVEWVVGRTVREIIPSIEYAWIETYNRVVQSGRSERVQNYVAELGKLYNVHAWRSGTNRFSAVFSDVTDNNPPS